MKHTLENIGKLLSIYSVSYILIWYGLFKFTLTEAKAIEGLISHSPLMSWMYTFGSLTDVSYFMGSFEILTGILLAFYPFHKKLAAIGALLSSIIFFTTLTFLFSTPHMFGYVDGLFVPTNGGFIVKDLVFLGISLSTAANCYESLVKKMVLTV